MNLWRHGNWELNGPIRINDHCRSPCHALIKAAYALTSSADEPLDVHVTHPHHKHPHQPSLHKIVRSPQEALYKQQSKLMLHSRHVSVYSPDHDIC